MFIACGVLWKFFSALVQSTGVVYHIKEQHIRSHCPDSMRLGILFVCRTKTSHFADGQETSHLSVWQVMDNTIIFHLSVWQVEVSARKV